MLTGHKLGARLDLAGPGAILAPMSGVTDVGFRRIASRFGASLVVSEMVASRELANGDAAAAMRAESTGLGPHVVQLAGCEPWWMAEAARVAEASGADAIDINMGCPAKRVTGGWAGSALMRDLNHALCLIRTVVAAVKVPVTLKMRLGWDGATLNAPELARRAVDAGIRAVTVHGRTRQQFFKGQADWTAIRRVRDVVSTPLIANGDVASVEQAEHCLVASGANAVMVGRAALGRPWLVGRIARFLTTGVLPSEPGIIEKRQAVIEHYETLLSLHGTQVGVRHARKHLAAYAEHEARTGAPPLGQAARERLVTSECPREVLRLLGEVFTTDATGVASREAA